MKINPKLSNCRLYQFSVTNSSYPIKTLLTPCIQLRCHFAILMTKSINLYPQRLLVALNRNNPMYKNKTNHPISSNSHPSATANKAKYTLKIGGRAKATGTSYKFGKV